MSEATQIQQGNSRFFDTTIEWQSSLFSVLELFPIPLEVFAPDGISLFVNRAFVESLHIDAEKLVGKFNVLEDPYLNHKIGLSDYLRRVFAGEVLSVSDAKVPFEEISIRYHVAKGKVVAGDLYQDIICFPLWSTERFLCGVIAMFMTMIAIK